MAADALARQLGSEELTKEFDSGLLWAPVSSRLLTSGERRLEASTFLTDGFGLRQGLEALDSTVEMAELAKVWQPSRLKGFPVTTARGSPSSLPGRSSRANIACGSGWLKP